MSMRWATRGFRFTTVFRLKSENEIEHEIKTEKDIQLKLNRKRN